jgi:hypothetical protein
LVKKAAEDNEMFGRFYISDPDFEIHNFSIEELAEVFWEMALEKNPDLGQEDKEQLFRKTPGAKTASEFFDLAKQALPRARNLNKGKEWGERLGKYAERNPTRQSSDCSEEYRPIMVAIAEARHAILCDYYKSQRDYRVSPDTGKMVERIPTSP